MPKLVEKKDSKTNQKATVKKRMESKKQSAKKQLAKKQSDHREVLFPSPSAEVHGPDNPITYDDAKHLLGWIEEGENDKWGTDYLLTHRGKKIRCTNNVNNRPLTMTSVNTLIQEYLRNRWRLNGESIIIGKTGLILNGQHTLIALVLAVDEWRDNPDKWPETTSEPTLQKVVVTGIDEDDDTVNTMDTCKPRTLWEVICRAAYFSDLPMGERKTVAKRTDQAIKMLWHRTNTHANAFAVRRTHAESIAFLNSHPKILEAVKFACEEDGKEGRVAKYISTGYAAASLYLMATSESNAETYYTDDNPNEKLLDFSQWDKACEFFVLLSSGDKRMQPIRNAIDTLIQEGCTGIEERWSILAKAWNLFKQGKTIDAEGLELEFQIKDDVRYLIETTLLGGIDVGDDGVRANDPSPEEIEQRAAKIRAKRYKSDPRVASQAKPGKWSEGDKAFAHNYDAFGNTCFGTIKKPYQCSDGEWRVFIEAEDGEWEVPVSSLSLLEFEKSVG